MISYKRVGSQVICFDERALLIDVLQSGTSFSGRRRSRSPSPVGIGVRSRSMDGRMPKITVDRTPSDESLASSCAQMSMTSPGSSSSPRSPISPPWSSNTAVAAKSKNIMPNALKCSFFQSISLCRQCQLQCYRSRRRRRSRFLSR